MHLYCVVVTATEFVKVLNRHLDGDHRATRLIVTVLIKRFERTDSMHVEHSRCGPTRIPTASLSLKKSVNIHNIKAHLGWSRSEA